jgi:hypothetical protein
MTLYMSEWLLWLELVGDQRALSLVGGWVVGRWLGGWLRSEVANTKDSVFTFRNSWNNKLPSTWCASFRHHLHLVNQPTREANCQLFVTSSYPRCDSREPYRFDKLVHTNQPTRPQHSAIAFTSVVGSLGPASCKHAHTHVPRTSASRHRRLAFGDQCFHIAGPAAGAQTTSKVSKEPQLGTPSQAWTTASCR